MNTNKEKRLISEIRTLKNLLSLYKDDVNEFEKRLKYYELKQESISAWARNRKFSLKHVWRG